MAKKQYMTRAYQKKTRVRLDRIVKITEEYIKMKQRLSVRQLYYQLVAHNVIPNSLKSYNSAMELIKNGRETGDIDWDCIVDRGRVPVMPRQYASVSEFMSKTAGSYRRNRWEGQPHYVEVMVEKDALTGVLEPIANEYHVLLLANKGYSSTSAMHTAAERISQEHESGKTCHILYMGDHDPSGVDMVRDIEKRLSGFKCTVEVERMNRRTGTALTEEQVKKYNPSPNPIKMSDSRTAGYLEHHGNRSWELDALNPQILAGILEKHILKYLDLQKYDKMLNSEEQGRKILGVTGCSHKGRDSGGNGRTGSKPKRTKRIHRRGRLQVQGGK